MQVTLEPVKSLSKPAARIEALGVVAARAASALEDSLVGFLQASEQNLGHFEVQAARDVQELLRQATERAAQAKADASSPRCPSAGIP